MLQTAEEKKKELLLSLTVAVLDVAWELTSTRKFKKQNTSKNSSSKAFFLSLSGRFRMF